MEGEIGGEAFGLGGIDVALGIANLETGGGGLADFIRNFQRDGRGGLAVEQDGYFAAEAEVLRALADVEVDLGGAFAFVAAVHLDDAILYFQAAELRLHGALSAMLHFAP